MNYTARGGPGKGGGPEEEPTPVFWGAKDCQVLIKGKAHQEEGALKNQVTRARYKVGGYAQLGNFTWPP